jgi:hypothetical protein
MSAPHVLAQCDTCDQFVEKFCDVAGLCKDCCEDCQKTGAEHE